MSALRLVPLTLILGDEELLVSRALATLTELARARDPQADIRTLDAESLDPAALLDLATGSLFGELRLVVVAVGGKLDDGVRDALLDHITRPQDDVCLVLALPNATTGKRLADAAKEANAQVRSCARVDKLRERVEFVEREFAEAGCPATEGAVRGLVDAVAVSGGLRELAAACAQLIADVGGPVDDSHVARYFRGRGESSGFAVADRAVEGLSGAALVELRQALQGGLDPVVIVSALARQLRMVARVASAGRAPADAVARQLGLAPWMVDKARRQGRGWAPESLTAAHAAVALADAEVKGGGADPAYAVERAVLAVASQGGQR